MKRAAGSMTYDGGRIARRDASGAIRYFFNDHLGARVAQTLKYNVCDKD